MHGWRREPIFSTKEQKKEDEKWRWAANCWNPIKYYEQPISELRKKAWGRGSVSHPLKVQPAAGLKCGWRYMLKIICQIKKCGCICAIHVSAISPASEFSFQRILEMLHELQQQSEKCVLCTFLGRGPSVRLTCITAGWYIDVWSFPHSNIEKVAMGCGQNQ